MGRAPAASEHALFSSVFVGATLRGRPFRNVNFAGFPQNANAVRFVGKRRCRRPKRRFFAGKPSNCAVHRRRPRHSVKGFSSYVIRASGQASRLRTFPGDHIGSPLRSHVSKCGFPRAPAASEHALYCSLFLLEKLRYFGGSSYIPQKQSFCGNPISHPISVAVVFLFSKKALPFWNFAVRSTAYNALLTRSSACKFRVKAQPCFGRPRRVAPTADASKYGLHRAE